MIRQTLPKPSLEIPQILTEQRRPILIRIIRPSLMRLPGIRIKGVQEPLDRLRGFRQQRVIRIPCFHDRADLYLGDEDAQVA